MNTRQEQTADGGAVAIQSCRDTNISTGISPEDMKSIIETLADQIPKYAAIASAIVDERLKGFEERILERFSKDSSTRSEAFSDPDFQYLLGSSQHAYARTGDDQIRDTLIDLIATRSMCTERSRLSLSLNKAVETSTALTKNEFAELSAVYTFRHSTHYVANFDAFIDRMKSLIVPLVPDISSEDSSYTYLESQGCASIGIAETPWYRILKETYGGVIGTGFPLERFNKEDIVVPPEVLTKRLLIRCMHNPENLQPSGLNINHFLEAHSESGVSQDVLKKLWAQYGESIFSEDDIRRKIVDRLPEMDAFFELWNSTPLKRLTITPVGIAIAHANLYRNIDGSPALSIWIK